MRAKDKFLVDVTINFTAASKCLQESVPFLLTFMNDVWECGFGNNKNSTQTCYCEFSHKKNRRWISFAGKPRTHVVFLLKCQSTPSRCLISYIRTMTLVRYLHDCIIFCLRSSCCSGTQLQRNCSWIPHPCKNLSSFSGSSTYAGLACSGCVRKESGRTHTPFLRVLLLHQQKGIWASKNHFSSCICLSFMPQWFYPLTIRITNIETQADDACCMLGKYLHAWE